MTLSKDTMLHMEEAEKQFNGTKETKKLRKMRLDNSINITEKKHKNKKRYDRKKDKKEFEL